MGTKFWCLFDMFYDGAFVTALSRIGFVFWGRNMKSILVLCFFTWFVRFSGALLKVDAFYIMKNK